MCSSSASGPLRTPRAAATAGTPGAVRRPCERPRAATHTSRNGRRDDFTTAGPSVSAVRPGFTATRPATRPEDIWRELRARLSPNARLILRVLDEDGAAFTRLVRACGGQALRIPRRLPPPDHELCRQLGADMLQRLMATFGGTVVYVPRCRFLLAAVRRLHIIRQYYRHTGSGCSAAAAVRALAREERLSDRRIRQILKTCDELPPGADVLFDLLDA